MVRIFNDCFLLVASFEDRYDIANVLVRHGAKVNAQDNQGQTALTLAVHSGFVGIVDLLLQKKADINVKNEVHIISSISVSAMYIWGVSQKNNPFDF